MLENGGLLRGEFFIHHVEIRFVIEPERAVVEIRRADRDPAVVDDHDFAVKHGRLVFVDRNPRFQKWSPLRTRCPAGEVGIDNLTRDDDFNLHTTLGGGNQLAARAIVGHEIGIGDQNPFARTGKRQ